MATFAERIRANKDKQEMTTGTVTSLAADTKVTKLRVFTTKYAGLNYTFASGKQIIFKPVLGQPTYYATEEEAKELAASGASHIVEVSGKKANDLAFKEVATDLHKVNLLVNT